MPSNEEVSAFLVDTLPSGVRKRLIADKEFMKTAGLGLGTKFGYATLGQFEHSVLSNAAREVLSSGIAQTVLNSDCREVEISVKENRLQLIRNLAAEEIISVTPSDLMLLAPDSERRLIAFDEMVTALGPTGPSPGEWRNVLECRALSDWELSSVLDEVKSSVPMQLSRAESAMRRGGAGLDDLFPAHVTYFEKLCGPNPSNSEPETYLSEPLQEFRRGLLAHDFAKGLELCIVGFLRDDLSAVKIIEDAGDQVVWDALAKIDCFGDPFSLLAVLDIALDRSKKEERFRDFAAEAVERLCKEEFPGDGAVNVYSYMPPLISLASEYLRSLDEACNRPPFWQRLCAWTHAGLLIRVMRKFEFDPQEMTDWCQSFTSFSGVLADLIDLRSEPMWHRENVNPRILRGEILARLDLIRDRFAAKGIPIPNENRLDAELANHHEKGHGLSIILPGPLDGHKLPLNAGNDRMYPRELIHKMRELLEPDLTSNVWHRLAVSSQVFFFDNDFLSELREVLKQTTVSGEPSQRQKELLSLANVSLVAAAHRDAELAEIIADKCIGSASETETGEEATNFVAVLIAAAAAFESQAESHTWLEDKLLPLISQLPKNEPCSAVQESIRILRRSGYLDPGRFARAEALAQMGAKIL